MNPVRGKKPKVSASLAMPSWTSNGMKFRALLFGVAILFTLVPAAAFATTTPVAQKPYCTLSASRSAVELGKTVNLSWQSQYATQGFITSIGAVGTNGMQGVIPTGSGTTYVGTFTGPGGTGNCSITISIIQPNGSGGDATSPGTVTSPGSTGVQNPGLVNPTSGIGGSSNMVDDPGSSGVLYPGTVDTPGGVGAPGTVQAPDRLSPSQSADSPTTLPPANEITLDKTPSKGLIPCSGIDCQACHLASLAQRIINFLIGLSIPLAAAMFAYAGVIYFTSGVVDKIEKAHKIFKSVGIGFMIVLGAWLGIQTVLKTILADEYYKSWNTIQCVGAGARPMDKTIGQLLSVLPGLNTLAPVNSSFNDRTGVFSGGLTPICSGEGYQLSYDMGGNQTCWNESNDSYQTPTYNNPDTSNYGRAGALCAPGNPACSPAALQALGFEPQEANAMSCIAVTESGGNPYTRPSETGACGLFQITNRTSKSNWQNPAYHGDGCGVTTSCNDPRCNAQTAQIMFNEQGYQPWTGIDPKTGKPWNPNARACVQKHDPDAYYNQVL